MALSKRAVIVIELECMGTNVRDEARLITF